METGTKMTSSCWRSSLVLLACMIATTQGRSFLRLCYFPNWAHQRPSWYARFDVDQVDPSLCTHLVYAFATIDVDSRRIVARYADEDPTVEQAVGRYRRFNDLKETNKHLKTLLSLGGERAGNDQFVAITKDDKSLQTFANTAVEFLRKRGFDGLDLDWEYPNATTKAQFTRLLKTLRTTFEAERSERDRLMLTVALPASRQRIEEGYDLAALSRYVDLASVMTYDYHGGWNTVTGFDSPLYSRKSNPQFNQELSTEWTVNYYLSQGLPAGKLLVGVTAAGTHFTLQDLNQTGVGAPVTHNDQPLLSELWQLPNRYAYPEICRVLQASNSQRVFDEEQQVPYVFQGEHWSGYEDVQSIKIKTEWMLKKGVAGVMFWALDMDDFTGKLCDLGHYPLLAALVQKVQEVEGSTQLTGEVNPDIHYLTRDGNFCTSSVRRGSWVLCLVGAAFTVLSVGMRTGTAL